MEIQDNNQISQNPKRKYWKFVAGFLGIIIGVFVLTNVGLWLWQSYSQWQGEKRVERLAEELKRLEQENYQRAMADTYGGKTPQETLQMYIEAVEKGDYELASKYFIEKNREEEVNELKVLDSKTNMSWFLNLIKKAIPDGEIVDNFFRMKSKTEEGPYYFIRFIKYPNDVWKIIEI